MKETGACQVLKQLDCTLNSFTLFNAPSTTTASAIFVKHHLIKDLALSLFS